MSNLKISSKSVDLVTLWTFKKLSSVKQKKVVTTNSYKNIKNIDLKHLTTPLHSASNVNLRFAKILESISVYKNNQN